MLRNHTSMKQNRGTARGENRRVDKPLEMTPSDHIPMRLAGSDLVGRNTSSVRYHRRV